MKVSDLLHAEMITASPHDTKADLERTMASRKVHALPIVDEAGRAVGLVTGNDLEPGVPDETPIAELMSNRVYTIDVDEEAVEAARMMRDLDVHHLVATEHDLAAGVLSSLDLLELVEEL